MTAWLGCLVQGGDHALPPRPLLKLPIRLIQPGILVWNLNWFMDALEGEVEEHGLVLVAAPG